jgi:squalene-hopene/tetraprenyl-beta-curcumene cyclase
MSTSTAASTAQWFARQFGDVPWPRRPGMTTFRLAAWIRSKQAGDVGWSVFHGGPANLSATLEAYTALRVAGDPAGAPHMQRAAALVRELGGIEASRVFTRFWLALFGEWPWERLPALPPEVILLPSWFPLNIYDFASWARQTISSTQSGLRSKERA